MYYYCLGTAQLQSPPKESTPRDAAYTRLVGGEEENRDKVLLDRVLRDYHRHPPLAKTSYGNHRARVTQDGAGCGR